MYSDKEIRKVGLAQARRWQQKVLLGWFGSEEKIPQQMLIIDECNDSGKQEESVPGVQEAGLVHGGEVSDLVHESSVEHAEDAGGRQHGVAASTEGEVGLQAGGPEVREAPPFGEHLGADDHLPKDDDTILAEGSGEQPQRQ
jgi:hypothetical protein